MIPLIYDHIGSSGGLSFVECIVPSFSEEQVLNYGDVCSSYTWDSVNALATDDLQRFKFIWGHAVHDFGNLIKLPYERITFLRHPVSRFISDYFWNTDQKESPWCEPNYDRALCRLADYVSSLEDSGRAWGENLPDSIGCLFNDRLTCDNLLFSAQNHLKNSYGFVGITELFEETQILLANRYPWLSIHPWRRRRVNSKAWDELDMDPSLMARIEHLVADDMVLYNEVREGVERQVQDFVHDDAYLSYKAGCILNDNKLIRHFLAGDTRYLPPMAPAVRLRLVDLFGIHWDEKVQSVAAHTAEQKHSAKLQGMYLNTIAEQQDRIQELENKLALLSRQDAGVT